MKQLAQKLGVSPAKLAVIVGLSAVMLGVWVNALAGSGSTARRPRPQQARVAENAQADAAAPSTSDDDHAAESLTERAAIPPVDADTVARVDPFRRPAWARSPNSRVRSVNGSDENGRETTLESLRETGVSLVVLTDGEKLAIVGERQVRPGDWIDGFRVLDITASGVVLDTETAKP